MRCTTKETHFYSQNTFHVLKHIRTHIHNQMRILKPGWNCLENVYYEGRAADRGTSSNTKYNDFISIHEHYPLALITARVAKSALLTHLP